MHIGKVLNPILKRVIRGMRIHEFHFFNQEPEIDGNVIYAVNHSCHHDAPYFLEATKRHCYIFAGKQNLYFMDRLFFILNGTVWVDRKNRKHRALAKEKVIQSVQKGNSFLIFPEGTWNLKPSLPTLPLYWGVIDIAKATGRPIVPVILEYRGDKCYFKYGSPIFVKESDDKQFRIEELKEAFATFKWEIWEYFPIEKRSENMKCEWEKEVQKRLDAYPKLDVEYEQSVIRGR